MSQAFRLSKQEATAEEAYQMAEPMHREGSLSPTYHLTYAWIAYRRLKSHYKQLGSKEARRMLATYLSLEIERPHVVHSSYLYLALAIKKEYPEFRFLKFLGMWGIEHFREDDWTPFQTEGATLMSLAQKAIYQGMSELKGCADDEGLVTMNLLLSQAVRRYPKTAEHHRQYGWVLARQGLRQEAIDSYKQALLCENKFYYWSELSALTDDRAMRKGALCMALSAQPQEDYLGAIHLQLAETLIEEGDFGQALVDLNKFYETYNRKKWSIPQNFNRIMARIPKGTAAARRDRGWLEAMASPARDFLLDDLPSVVLLVEGFFVSKKGKEMVALKEANGRSIVVPKSKMPRRMELKTGDFVKARTRQSGSHQTDLLGITAATEEEVGRMFGQVLTLTGRLTTKQNAAGKTFGFVKNCYVGGHLLSGLKQGQMVSVRAVRKDDKTTAIEKPVAVDGPRI